MTLLRITVTGEALPPILGNWSRAGPQHRLILAPALSLASAASAVRLALRANPAAWVIVQGGAVAPFLSAVTANLSLAVAGAFLLSPQPWASRPLELAPLSFPSAVATALPDITVKTHASAWGAILLTLRNLFSQPQVRALIDRRNRDLARTAGPRLVDAPYAAFAGSASGLPNRANSARVLRSGTPAIASRTSSIVSSKRNDQAGDRAELLISNRPF